MSNLTGGQVQEVLDTLIYEGLKPIILNSDVFDIQLIHLLGVASTNKKRKISALDREVFIDRVCHALTTHDVSAKFDLIAGAKIERGFIYNFLTNFIKVANGYSHLYVEYLTCSKYVEKSRLDQKLAAIERTLCFSRDRLYSTLNSCIKYVELAYDFRNQIVEQYIKHAYRQAHAYCKEKGKTVNFDDVHQSLMASITKAVDKYDSSKGALTSYINYWVLNSLTYPTADYGHEYGVAYLIPQAQKKSMQGTKAAEVNFSVSLNSLLDTDSETSLADLLASDQNIEASYEDRIEAETVAYLVKSADPSGLARLYLDLEEFISPKEKERMVKTMKNQLGYVPKF